MMSILILLIVSSLGMLAMATFTSSVRHSQNYSDALLKSILFFEGQRSEGYGPPNE
ncbi:putative cellulase [Rosa chinensis]|uniref:Putative cellulase n=1 Tax=Rosa chinensis TaxID=74649 RepID=A0A2P6S1N2_ROSCH|nr:putative cellulase [Rosa chinensis]